MAGKARLKLSSNVSTFKTMTLQQSMIAGSLVVSLYKKLCSNFENIRMRLDSLAISLEDLII